MRKLPTTILIASFSISALADTPHEVVCQTLKHSYPNSSLTIDNEELGIIELNYFDFVNLTVRYEVGEKMETFRLRKITNFEFEEIHENDVDGKYTFSLDYDRASYMPKNPDEDPIFTFKCKLTN